MKYRNIVTRAPVEAVQLSHGPMWRSTPAVEEILGADENWGALVRPEGAANEIRVPHKDVLPWGLYRQRIRMVRSLESAFKEIHQYAAQDRILNADGVELPQPVEFL